MFYDYHYTIIMIIYIICPLYLVDEFSPCVLWVLMIKLMMVLLTLFWMEYGFTSMGS